MNEQNIIIISIFCFLFYFCDFIALYRSIKTINIIEKMNSNKKENIFFLFARSFLLIGDFANLSYCISNNIQSLLILNSIFVSFDGIFIILRTVYGVFIIRIIKQNSEIVIMRPTVGDDNKIYYRPTVVANPVLNNV